MLINNFALPDSRYSKSYSTEELRVCDSESVKRCQMKGERARGRRMEKREGRQQWRPWLLQVVMKTPRGSTGIPLLLASYGEYGLSAESRLSRGSFE